VSTIVLQDSNAAVIGSAPSVAGSPEGSGFDIAWKGEDGHLYLTHYDVLGQHFSARELLSLAGTLGSAPSIAEGPGTGNAYVFWKGTDANLWEAYWNAATGAWSLINLHMGPLG
jgi:hypothetical protein